MCLKQPQNAQKRPKQSRGRPNWLYQPSSRHGFLRHLARVDVATTSSRTCLLQQRVAGDEAAGGGSQHQQAPAHTLKAGRSRIRDGPSLPHVRQRSSGVAAMLAVPGAGCSSCGLGSGGSGGLWVNPTIPVGDHVDVNPSAEVSPQTSRRSGRGNRLCYGCGNGARRSP